MNPGQGVPSRPPRNSMPWGTVLYGITDHDVLSGRGVNISQHKGNERFRALVHARHDDDYCYSYSTAEKRAMAEEVVSHIQSLDPSGRFLKRPAEASSTRGSRYQLDGPWEELTPEEAIKKTCQALRDGNRRDRTGYGSNVKIPADVQVSSKRRSETGMSTKELAEAAAANKQLAEAAAAKQKATTGKRASRPDDEPVAITPASGISAFAKKPRGDEGTVSVAKFGLVGSHDPMTFQGSLDFSAASVPLVLPNYMAHAHTAASLIPNYVPTAASLQNTFDDFSTTFDDHKPQAATDNISSEDRLLDPLHLTSAIDEAFESPLHHGDSDDHNSLNGQEPQF